MRRELTLRRLGDVYLTLLSKRTLYPTQLLVRFRKTTAPAGVEIAFAALTAVVVLGPAAASAPSVGLWKEPQTRES